jgi:hypothetical protein
MPLTGLIPDMEADNPKYIALQQCYEYRAERDMRFIAQLAESISKKRNAVAAVGPGGGGVVHDKAIDLELLQRFCRNAWTLKVGYKISSIILYILYVLTRVMYVHCTYILLNSNIHFFFFFFSLSFLLLLFVYVKHTHTHTHHKMCV